MAWREWAGSGALARSTGGGEGSGVDGRAMVARRRLCGVQTQGVWQRHEQHRTNSGGPRGAGRPAWWRPKQLGVLHERHNTSGTVRPAALRQRGVGGQLPAATVLPPDPPLFAISRYCLLYAS